ncbi:MAG: hypothetical protein CFE21_04895 [Bacteroidetes bacterium B1(2017)]|nr:MAG: hypothetical protein CFE21_04895 [Bacteroidetes bacterium B1(2017)]
MYNSWYAREFNVVKVAFSLIYLIQQSIPVPILKAIYCLVLGQKAATQHAQPLTCFRIPPLGKYDKKPNGRDQL